MRFAMESQELKELSFCIVFRKNKRLNFQKNAKYPIFGAFLHKFGQKWIFHKNQATSFFYSPLTSCKKSEKANEPILRKNSYITYKRTNELTREIIGPIRWNR